MDLAFVKIEVMGSQFVVFLLAILVHQVTVMVNMLVDLLQGGVLTVVLVEMILKGHDRVFIHEHNILCLG